MILIDNISFAWQKDQPLFNGFSLSLAEGEIHGIAGLNGAGKTTLLNILATYLKPDHGHITINGNKPSGKQITFLETENFFYAHITGREYLQLFKNKHFNNDAWNELFGLPLDELIEHYSTGMKKKLAIMACIRSDKPVMILDEPFNGLDLESSRMLRSLLIKIRASKTILITSHILESLTNLCDHIHYIEKGKLVFSQAKQDFSEIEHKIFRSLEDKHQDLLGRLLDS